MPCRTMRVLCCGTITSTPCGAAARLPRPASGHDAPCAGQVRRPGQAGRLGPRAAHHPPAVARRSALSRCRGATPQRRVDGGVVRSQWGCVGVSRARPARHATSRGAGPALRRRMCWGAMCVLRAAPAWMRERVKSRISPSRRREAECRQTDSTRVWHVTVIPRELLSSCGPRLSHGSVSKTIERGAPQENTDRQQLGRFRRIQRMWHPCGIEPMRTPTADRNGL